MLEPVIPSDHPGRRELVALRVELESCWCADTSFWPELWTPAHPSVGQCAVTALVVSDRFGGEILRTVNQDVVHYWNRLSGVDVDLTRDQFERWSPQEDLAEISHAELASSGPTLGPRYQRLAAALHAKPRPRDPST